MHVLFADDSTVIAAAAAAADVWRMRRILPRIRIQSFRGPQHRRGLAAAAGGRAPAVFEVFNSHTKWLQKERAAADVEGSRQADYLKDEVAARVCERLLVNTSLGPERKASRLWLRRF